MSSGKLIVQLNGGLGNQMFQYATGRALAEKNNAELVLDTWSGFVRDKLYNRQYELDSFPIKSRAATALERFPIWLYRIELRLKKKVGTTFQNHIYGNFILETELKYLSEVANKNLGGTHWLLGYWQSPKYFINYTEQIKRELEPPKPPNKNFLELAKEIKNEESVALGIRLYEESFNPALHGRDGNVKTAADVNNAIVQLLKEKPDARFYVFCTHKSAVFNELKLPVNTKFVLPSEGYDGTIENLWLLTQCKHHIFTNSSFYWWGAWLSQNNYQVQSQLVFAANNFINPDSYCTNWKTF